MGVDCNSDLGMYWLKEIPRTAPEPKRKPRKDCVSSDLAFARISSLLIDTIDFCYTMCMDSCLLSHLSDLDP